MKYTGLLGNNIQYSASPKVHNEYYRLNDINLNYQLFDLKQNEIAHFLEKLEENNIIGFNVTIPYKEYIIDFLDQVTCKAKDIGAVNTVVLENNKLMGYNTDYLGFIKSLKVNGINALHGRALIIGNGGAAKSIFFALKDLGIEFIDITGRDKCKILRNFCEIDNFVEFDSTIDCNNYSIIINCTPLGGVNYPLGFILKLENTSEKNILYDLNYIPDKTLFLKKGEENGAKIINGKDMLKFQAHFAIDIWQASLKEQEDE